MAIFTAETGSFSGSPNQGFVESPKHARNSTNSVPGPVATATLSQMFAGAACQQTTLLNYLRVDDEVTPGVGIFVYSLTAGALGPQIAAGLDGNPYYYMASPVKGTFQNAKVVLIPGIYTWRLDYFFTLATGSISATTFDMEFGICGVPTSSTYTTTSTLFNPAPPNALNIVSQALGTCTAPTPAGSLAAAVQNGTFNCASLLGPTSAFVLYFKITNLANAPAISGAFGGQWLLTAQIGGDPSVSDPLPNDPSVVHPASITLVVSASGNTTISYQWQVNSGSGFSNITTAGTPGYSGYTTNTLTISTTATSMDSWQYRCVVTNTAGSATSNSTPIFVT